MWARDRLGWPVELIRGRRVLNLIRLLLHTDVVQTWRGRRHRGPGHYLPARAVVGVVIDGPTTGPA